MSNPVKAKIALFLILTALILAIVLYFQNL